MIDIFYLQSTYLYILLSYHYNTSVIWDMSIIELYNIYETQNGMDFVTEYLL